MGALQTRDLWLEIGLRAYRPSNGTTGLKTTSGFWIPFLLWMFGEAEEAAPVAARVLGRVAVLEALLDPVLPLPRAAALPGEIGASALPGTAGAGGGAAAGALASGLLELIEEAAQGLRGLGLRLGGAVGVLGGDRVRGLAGVSGGACDGQAEGLGAGLEAGRALRDPALCIGLGRDGAGGGAGGGRGGLGAFGLGAACQGLLELGRDLGALLLETLRLLGLLGAELGALLGGEGAEEAVVGEEALAPGGVGEGLVEADQRLGGFGQALAAVDGGGAADGVGGLLEGGGGGISLLGEGLVAAEAPLIDALARLAGHVAELLGEDAGLDGEPLRGEGAWTDDGGRGGLGEAIGGGHLLGEETAGLLGHGLGGGLSGGIGGLALGGGFGEALQRLGEAGEELAGLLDSALGGEAAGLGGGGGEILRADGLDPAVAGRRRGRLGGGGLGEPGEGLHQPIGHGLDGGGVLEGLGALRRTDGVGERPSGGAFLDLDGGLPEETLGLPDAAGSAGTAGGGVGGQDCGERGVRGAEVDRGQLDPRRGGGAAAQEEAAGVGEAPGEGLAPLALGQDDLEGGLPALAGAVLGVGDEADGGAGAGVAGDIEDDGDLDGPAARALEGEGLGVPARVLEAQARALEAEVVGGADPQAEASVAAVGLLAQLDAGRLVGEDLDDGAPGLLAAGADAEEGLEGGGEGQEEVLARHDGQGPSGEEGLGGAALDGEAEASALGDASLAVARQGLDGGALGVGGGLEPGLDLGRGRDGAPGGRPEGAFEGGAVGLEHGQGDEGAQGNEDAQRPGVPGGEPGGGDGRGGCGQRRLGAGLVARPEGEGQGVLGGGAIAQGAGRGVGEIAVEAPEGVGLGGGAPGAGGEEEAGRRQQGEGGQEGPVEGLRGIGKAGEEGEAEEGGRGPGGGPDEGAPGPLPQEDEAGAAEAGR